MSKRKNKKQSNASKSTSAKQSKVADKIDDSPVEAIHTGSSSWRIWFGVIAGIVLLGGGLLWVTGVLQPRPQDKSVQRSAALTKQPLTEDQAESESDSDALPAVSSSAGFFPNGPANRCFGGPRFQKKLGFQSGQSYIGTSPGQIVGLFLADVAGENRVYQDPTWDDGGNLGSFIYDGQGHLYLVPAIFMHLHTDRLEDQTKLYRVDSDSAEMSVLIDLPAAAPPHTGNPHGLTGLFYDCDLDSIYVTSVAGSTSDRENGRIFQVNLKSKKVVSTYENVDATSVGVFTSPKGKRLYFGSGRNTGVYSLALDRNGRFSGTPRLEFYLAALPGGRNDKAMRITFNQNQEMVVKGLSFTYTLAVEQPTLYRDYTLGYDAENDTWESISVESKSK